MGGWEVDAVLPGFQATKHSLARKRDPRLPTEFRTVPWTDHNYTDVAIPWASYIHLQATSLNAHRSTVATVCPPSRLVTLALDGAGCHAGPHWGVTLPTVQTHSEDNRPETQTHTENRTGDGTSNSLISRQSAHGHTRTLTTDKEGCG